MQMPEAWASFDVFVRRRKVASTSRDRGLCGFSIPSFAIFEPRKFAAGDEARVNGVKGEVAVVTGASRGVGRRIAVRLAKMGVRVALVARSHAALEETRTEIEAHGGRALAFPADLGETHSIRPLKDAIECDLGVPSILVNAAGVFGPIDLVGDTDPAAWIETIQINAIAPYLTCRAFVVEWCSRVGAALSM